MATRPLLLIAAATVLSLAAPSFAQQAPQSRAQGGDQPVMFGADTGEYTSEGFALRGRAEVLQGGNRLRADAINGFTSNGQLSRVEATGNVYFVTPDQTIRGGQATYTLANDTVVVTGEVILTQGRNVMTGSRLTYNTRTQSARIEGSPRGAAGNRIQGVFYPQGNAN